MADENACIKAVSAEILTLLKWCILAASTVGPGHILSFTFAGAMFQMRLMWAVLVSAAVAFIMQEAVARLCIISGRSFGEALQVHFKGHAASPGDGSKLWYRISHSIVGAIIVSNMAFGCSTLTGFHSAAVVLGYPDAVWARVLLHALFASAVGTTIFNFDVTTIASSLGIIVLALTGSFAVAAGLGDFDWTTQDFVRGAFIPSFPPGSEETALAMMGSTGSPFILFLSSSVQSDETLGVALFSMQRGVFTSNWLGMLVSALILIVGSLVPADADLSSVGFISQVLVEKEGKFAKFVFCVSFLVACFSAALTTFLGAAIATRSLLGQTPEQCDPRRVRASSTLIPPWEGDVRQRFSSDFRNEVRERASSTIRSRASRGGSRAMTITEVMGDSVKPQPWDASEGDGADLALEEDQDEPWSESGTRFRGLIVAMLVADFGICSAGVTIKTIVLTASIIGGVLMPFLMWPLLRCMNDPQLMGARRQPLMANIALGLSVSICLYLAVDGVVELLIENGLVSNIIASCATAVGGLAMVLWLVRNGNRNTVPGKGLGADQATEITAV